MNLNNLKDYTNIDKSKNLGLFREAVKDYISNLNIFTSIKQQKESLIKFETHNAFGEAKRRFKVRKKGKMGSRAHLRKIFQNEIILNNIQNLEIFNEKKILENWLNLNNSKTFLNLKKYIFLDNLNKKRFLLEILFKEKQRSININKELKIIMNSFFKGEKFILDEIKAQKLIIILSNYMSKKRPKIKL